LITELTWILIYVYVTYKALIRDYHLDSSRRGKAVSNCQLATTYVSILIAYIISWLFPMF